MLSLHRLFEVLGAQLTPHDLTLLSFLTDESVPPHEEEEEDDEEEEGEAPHACPPSAKRRRLRPPPTRTPRDGVEFLLELERRGLCHEGNFRYLRDLLRLITRHDLLRCLSTRRPRTVSPERFTCGPAVVGGCLSSAPRPRQETWEMGSTSGKRKRGGGPRGGRRGRTRPPLPPPHPAPPPPQDPPAKVTCDIRLRVRAEFSEHDSALRRGVSSLRPRGPDRALDVFGQASGVLKSRDLGSILCDIKFSELSYLDAFWGDYLNGSLLEALKGVFLTEGLRRAVGREDVRLLVSVDQDDYEEGRRLLLRAAQKS